MDNKVLVELIYIFCLSIVVLLVCHKIKIPAIVGFLITGVLCGPSALGVVADMEIVDFLAEVGIILLLFTIGMELSAEELIRLKKPIFVGGTCQVLFTILAVCGVFLAFGQELSRGFLFGALAALSSTAIVLSLLQTKGQTEAPYGKVSLSILIFQDIAIVPLMLVIPLFAGGAMTSLSEVAFSAAKALAMLAAILLGAKFLLPRIMHLVVRTKSRELMLMSVLGICITIAFLTSSIGLSLSLGAFLAGLLLAESEYSLNALEGVLPFKDVFSSIFFISVGMLLDINFFFEYLPYVLLLAFGLIILKTLITLPSVFILGYSLRVAIISALALAQIGEFSFILAKTGLSYNIIDNFEYQMFLAASIITMSLTPLQLALAPKIANIIGKATKAKESPLEKVDPKEDLSDHLIIVGFGVGGKHLARTAKDCNIPYIIIEMNPDTVKRYKHTEPIFHGDATRPLVLEHLGVKKARVLAVVVSSDPSALRAIIFNARKLNPNIHLVVRTRFLGEMQALHNLGANDVVPEEFETSLEIFSRVLKKYLVPSQTIEHIVEHIRSENYNLLLDKEESCAWNSISSILPGIQITSVLVEEHSEFANMTIEETQMRQDFNVNLAAILRNNQVLESIDGKTKLLPNDVVYLLGSSVSIASVTIKLRA